MKAIIQVASEAIDQLFSDGKIIEGIIAIWESAVPPVIFYGTVLMAIFGIIYVRQQSFIPLALLLVLLFVIIFSIIPMNTLNFVFALVALILAGLIYRAIFRRKT